MKKVLLMVTLSVFPRLLVAQELDIQSLLGERWYGLYMNGNKVGHVRSAVSQQSDKRVIIEEDADFSVSMGGTPQKLSVRTKRVYEPEGNVVRIEEAIHDPAGVTEFKGHVEGDALVVRAEINGVGSERQLKKPEESLTDALEKAKLTAGGAQVGDSLRFHFFELMLLKELEGTSTITAVTERLLDGTMARVFEVRTHLEALGVETVAYVTEQGMILEDTFSGNLTMRLEPKEVAQDAAYANDVIVQGAAMLETPLSNPRDRTALELRMSGPLKPEHLISDDRQQWESLGNGEFKFCARRHDLEGWPASELPIQDEKLAQWTQATLYVQSDAPELVSQARSIVEDTKDSLEATRRLCRWVHDSVRSTYSARLTNALEVLTNLEGDCTEHSILFVGLARAAGLPAREVAGLIYMDDPRPGFYFHQWAKVWVGKWVDVDPTFDQVPVDATHVKLSEGDLLEQVKLMPLIGQVRISLAAGA